MVSLNSHGGCRSVVGKSPSWKRGVHAADADEGEFGDAEEAYTRAGEPEPLYVVDNESDAAASALDTTLGTTLIGEAGDIDTLGD